MIKKEWLNCGVVIGVFFAILGSLEAYQWPSQRFTLDYTFGQYSPYGVRKGVGIRAASSEVGVILPGELLFEQGPMSFFPSKKGYTRVVVHEKEELLSVYSGLTSLELMSNELLESDSITGRFGVDRGGSYVLTMFDLKLGQYVNPLVFLPTGFAGAVPVIAGIFLRYEDGEMVALRSGVAVRVGVAEILVDVYSRTSMGTQLMPRIVSLRLMGDRASSVELNAFTVDEGRAVLVGTRRVLANDLYDERGLLRLTSVRLFQGQISVVLRATNSDGLGRETAMRFSVVS